MAAPFTGPFTESVTELGGPNAYGYRPQKFWKSVTRRGQARPFNLPLDFAFFSANSSYASTSPSYSQEYFGTAAYNRTNSASWANGDVAAAYNKAYARLLTKIKGEEAQLGAALVEWRKTASMVNNRAFQFFQFVRAVRRGRFGDANYILGVPRKFRPKARGLGGIVLEYSFGWAPTVNDIQNGMKVLTGGIPPVWVKSQASAPMSVVITQTGSYPDRFQEQSSGKVLVKCGAVVYLANPNLWLANQLGFTNLAGIAWEVTPFSFLIDYFINVGAVVNSWSDTLGITLGNTYRQWGLEMTSGAYQEHGLMPAGPPYFGALSISSYTGNTFRLVRETGALPGPSLQFTAPNVSLRRATTSIALLLQLLKGK